MVVEKRNNGISLISLIITIIVIIILSAIVIFSGMDTPEKAQLSKVISDIDNVQTAVDQAYYGLYTEKAVAGEVWTQSQFYEAVATGEKNRDNLNGTGLIEISENSLVDINLPKYEGRKWYVAVSDMSDTVKVGSAVLSPGFESQGKIYATLLDIQNGGSDGSGANGGNQGGVQDENSIVAKLQVGDYIDYMPDSSNSYTLDPTTLKPSTSVSWRVWKIEGDKVIIMPTSPVNSFYLSSSTGFVNSVDIINDVCKMYANEAYGVSADDIRSLTIEDLEEVSNLPEIRDAYSNYGKTNAEINGNSGYTNGTFYTESDGKTIKKDGIVAGRGAGEQVVIKQTYYYASNPTWKSIENSKFSSATYGSLLGGNSSWLASPCVNLYSSYAYFYVRLVDSSSVGAYGLFGSSGGSAMRNYGVRPLVSLGSELQIDTSYTARDGSTAKKAYKIKLKEELVQSGV